MKTDEKAGSAAQNEAGSRRAGDATAGTDAAGCCGGAQEGREPRPAPAPRQARKGCCCG